MPAGSFPVDTVSALAKTVGLFDIYQLRALFLDLRKEWQVFKTRYQMEGKIFKEAQSCPGNATPDNKGLEKARNSSCLFENAGGGVGGETIYFYFL